VDNQGIKKNGIKTIKIREKPRKRKRKRKRKFPV